jgi:hydroxymethylpyrimidine/phosphomethylpyrimidine kinase
MWGKYPVKNWLGSHDVIDLNEKIDMIGRLYLGLEQIEDCEEFSALIPEVRTNFVYASKESATPEDVVAVDGRISIVDGFPKATGRIKFGASSYRHTLCWKSKKKILR